MLEEPKKDQKCYVAINVSVSDNGYLLSYIITETVREVFPSVYGCSVEYFGCICEKWCSDQTMKTRLLERLQDQMKMSKADLAKYAQGEEISAVEADS